MSWILEIELGSNKSNSLKKLLWKEYGPVVKQTNYGEDSIVVHFLLSSTKWWRCQLSHLTSSRVRHVLVMVVGN